MPAGPTALTATGRRRRGPIPGQASVCQPAPRNIRIVGPAPECTVTVECFESQKRASSSPLSASLKAGGSRRYEANRSAAARKCGSTGDSFLRRSTT